MCGGGALMQRNLPLDQGTIAWLEEHPEEGYLLDRFVGMMAHELAANDHKGNRPGWLQMNESEAVAEVLYHAAKLSYAVRQFRQGDGRIEKVREFAADVANCALMTLDVTEQGAARG